MTLPAPPPRPRIAVIEDHAPLRENTLQALRARDLHSWGVDSAEAFYRQALVTPPDIVVIDLGLPGEDGVSAIRHLRQQPALGIIAVTARGSLQDRLEGMAAGADHYLVKPVDLKELLAAISSLWRRQSPWAQEIALVPPPQDAASAGPPWRLDTVNSRIWSPTGQPVLLTGNELSLLACLAAHPGELVDKRELCHHLFPGDSDASYHRVEVTMSRLRGKFRAQDLAMPVRVVFGRGMALVAPVVVSGRSSA